MILRAVAVLIALGLLAASAHALIVHLPDGYASPHAIVTIALAAGIAVGALAIGAAWEQRRRALAFVIGIALLCGEAFGLVATAERIIAQRDGAQTTITAAHAQREALRRRLEDAEKAHASASTSPRLEAATAAKAAADNATLAKAAERGCAANCRALLEQQVISAGAELAAARIESEQRRTDAAAAVKAARTALEVAHVPPSATPLADRIGLAGWQLDLIAATLGSLAVNGLAAALLVFAGHGKHAPRPMPASTAVATRFELHASEIEPARTIAARATPAKMQPVNVTEHAAKFGVDCLEPLPHAHASLEAIKARYLDWCESIGVEPLPDAQIGKALADLFAGAGLHAEDWRGRVVIVGIAVKPVSIARAQLHAAGSEIMRVVEHRGKTATGSQPAGPVMSAVS